MTISIGRLIVGPSISEGSHSTKGSGGAEINKVDPSPMGSTSIITVHPCVTSVPGMCICGKASESECYLDSVANCVQSDDSQLLRER